MFESLFGAEMPLPVRFFIAFLIVLGLIGVTAWVVRRFGGERLGATTSRGRQPRLAVIDAAAVDGRRRLILIRRDNVEHLLMIGGPTDVVIEPNIVRAAAAGRDLPASQRPPSADTLPRPVPLGDAGHWPLQPEPAPAPRLPRAPVREEPEQWPVETELPPQPAPRRNARAIDPLVSIAAEVGRFHEPRVQMPDHSGPTGGFTPREPTRSREPVREPLLEPEPRFELEQPLEHDTPHEHDTEHEHEREIAHEREPMREREPARMMREPGMRETTREQADPARERPPTREPARLREPQPQPPMAEPEFNADADQNLADMAQRLEAALRRSPKSSEARQGEPTPRAVAMEAESTPPAPPVQARPAPAAEPKPTKSLYDSLEKEMASLLGRPSGKP